MTEASIDLRTAYRAAFHLVDAYVALEQHPDAGLVLLHQYMHSDPARWSDWKAAVALAQQDGTPDPLVENILLD